VGEELDIGPDRVEEDLDKNTADNTAFFLGIGHSGEARKKALGSIDRLDPDADFGKNRLYLGGLVEAEQPGVDEDVTGINFRLVKQSRKNGRIDAAGDTADDFASRHFGLNPLDELVLERGDFERRQVFGEGEEVFEDLAAFFRVRDLGVKLDPIEEIVPFQRDGDAVEVTAGDLAIFGEDADGVGVAHPDLRVTLEAVENALDARLDHQGRRAILAGVTRGHFATKLAVEQLHPVTDTEDGDAHLHEVIEVNVGRTGFQGRAGSTREDDSGRLAGLVQFRRLVEAGKITKLSDPANDQLRVLGSEVNDGDGVVHG